MPSLLGTATVRPIWLAGGVPDPDPVLVVGAGPTGLVAALLLARYVAEVTIVERRVGVHALPVR